jgi:hypothetical protein
MPWRDEAVPNASGVIVRAELVKQHGSEHRGSCSDTDGVGKSDAASWAGLALTRLTQCPTMSQTVDSNRLTVGSALRAPA